MKINRPTTLSRKDITFKDFLPHLLVLLLLAGAVVLVIIKVPLLRERLAQPHRLVIASAFHFAFIMFLWWRGYTARERNKLKARQALARQAGKAGD